MINYTLIIIVLSDGIRMTETERREASESLNEWITEQPGVSLTSSHTDTVFFENFAEWFSTSLFPYLHNCVGDRLIDYSLSTSLQANRALPKKQLDRKTASQQKSKKQKYSRRGSKVPYQKDLLHPADLLNNQSKYYEYTRDDSDEDDNRDDNAVNTRIRGLPPRIQVPPLDSSSMSFLNLFGDLVSPSSSSPSGMEPEQHISPSFHHPRTMPPSDSFMVDQKPPIINVPSWTNPFEVEIDPFFHSFTLPRMPKPLTRNDSFYSHDGSESEESVNNQPNSPDIIKQPKKYVYFF